MVLNANEVPTNHMVESSALVLSGHYLLCSQKLVYRGIAYLCLNNNSITKGEILHTSYSNRTINEFMKLKIYNYIFFKNHFYMFLVILN